MWMVWGKGREWMWPTKAFVLDAELLLKANQVVILYWWVETLISQMTRLTERMVKSFRIASGLKPTCLNALTWVHRWCISKDACLHPSVMKLSGGCTDIFGNEFSIWRMSIFTAQSGRKGRGPRARLQLVTHPGKQLPNSTVVNAQCFWHSCYAARVWIGWRNGML